ncbi:carbon storage regulator [Sporomusaceae bacterium BoRhaA]|uniref:carbon storage regulator CsrA n=1 Tax=Pelorhabdus rhamnosifermentans TaxID=2772457 RepID=UPI001C05F62C|nr:carbon storage regulator CsrA [Pelorhabdus rhamnosifermentans]MBU2699149.1 carbon storage regulator [Pelorhabdus rhamnosifermentans]
MLILTRKKQQSVRIGENIVVTVLEVKGDQVRLGFEAPREVAVLRQEVYEAVKESNEQAASMLKKVDVTSALQQVSQVNATFEKK